MVGPLDWWMLKLYMKTLGKWKFGNVKNPNAKDPSFCFCWTIPEFKHASATTTKYQPADFWSFHIQQRKPQMEVTWFIPSFSFIFPAIFCFFPNCQQIMRLRCSEFAFNIPSEDLKHSPSQFWRFHDPPPHDASNFLLATQPKVKLPPLHVTTVYPLKRPPV